MSHRDHESVHGGLDYAELMRHGLTAANVVDFSSNILPDGPSPDVACAVRSVDLASYPDRDCSALRQAISQHYSIGFESILVGNGCCELIHNVALSILNQGDCALIVGPTFSEYARASRLAGAEVMRCDAVVEDDFAIPTVSIENHLKSGRVRLVWICNPNNPTGQMISSDQILDWSQRFPETIFVIDESYIEFSPSARSVLESLPLSGMGRATLSGVIVLRSMTKSFALAGLRLGFAVLSERWYTRIAERRIPWSVNAVAQAAGIAAIKSTNYYRSAMIRLSESKRNLVAQLQSLGYRIVSSETGFFLMFAGEADQLRERLLQQGVLVRDCTSFGLGGWVRIAVGTAYQNAVLVSRLAGHAVLPAPRATPIWDDGFREQLKILFQLRRDVRRFSTEPLADGTLRRLLEAACMAPSVGLSQPWQFVSVSSSRCRSEVIAEFEAANQIAALAYDDATRDEYCKLKLAGLREAPQHLAIFAERDPQTGRSLGRATMPETVAYSVVASIQNFWLAARAEGIGVGWVSILRPEAITSILNVDAQWQLIAYLCVGYPMDQHVEQPELERLGWESRRSIDENWTER